MGNCQAAEAATVVIQHPEGKVERAYWSLSASQVMAANPGHYVAAVIVTASSSSNRSRNDNSNNAVNGDRSNSGNRKAVRPVKHLKLLRPDDTLHIGHVYRLVSFEEVLREFASKKHVKLSRLLAKKADHKPTRSQRRSNGNAVGCSASARGRITTTPSASAENTNRKPEPEKQQKARVEEEEEEEAAAAAAAARVEAELEEAMQRLMAVGGSSGRSSRVPYRHHAQWRPALQSIAEAGSTAT